MRCTVWAALPSGLFWICSAVTELTTPTLIRCWSSASLTLPRSAAADTVTAESCMVAVDSEIFCSSVLPASMKRPVTVLGW